MPEDNKWRRQFENFKKALARLDEILAVKEPNDFEKDGTIQRFEFTFEQAWKVLKVYLEEMGHGDLKGSKDAIRRADELNVIEDGTVWLDMVEKRNDMSHHYDEGSSREAYDLIANEYAPALHQLASFLNKES